VRLEHPTSLPDSELDDEAAVVTNGKRCHCRDRVHR
jgi:hypothetical protein